MWFPLGGETLDEGTCDVRVMDSRPGGTDDAESVAPQELRPMRGSVVAAIHRDAVVSAEFYTFRLGADPDHFPASRRLVGSR